MTNNILGLMWGLLATALFANVAAMAITLNFAKVLFVWLLSLRALHAPVWKRRHRLCRLYRDT